MGHKGRRRAKPGEFYARFSFEVRDFGEVGKISFITINVREYQKDNRLVEIRTVYSWSQLRNFLNSYGDDLDKGESDIISRFIRSHLQGFPKTSKQSPNKYLGQAVPIGDRSLRTRLAIESVKERAQPEKVELPVPEVRKLLVQGSSGDTTYRFDGWLFGKASVVLA